MKRLKIALKLLGVFVLLFILSNCGEELITLSPPKIEINTVKEIAFGNFEIELIIDRGEKQNIETAEIILEDITQDSYPDIVQSFIVNNDRHQVINVRISNAKTNHDYKARVVITTSEFEYSSEIKIIRASKNNFSLEILEDAYYADYSNNISSFATPGDSIIVLFNFQSDIVNKALTFKLNRLIEIDHNLKFDGNHTIGNGNNILTGNIYIPSTTEPGIYDLWGYIDGIAIQADSRIKVLKNWKIFDDTFPGEELVRRAWFVTGDDLIVVGGSPLGAPVDYPVWKFDLKNRKWSRMNDFPKNSSEYVEVLHHTISYQDQGYILKRIQNAPPQIWIYIKENDSWKLVTEYPVNASSLHTNFTINNKLFVIGISLQSNNWLNPEYQLWSFDFIDEKWERLNDIPDRIFAHNTAACSAGNKGYVMEPGFSNRMWEYTPDNDSWALMPRFTGPKRTYSNLFAFNGKIYFIGGEQEWADGITLKDCWIFSPSDYSWTLNSFLPKRARDGIVFSWNSKIIYGMSYYLNMNVGINYDSELFELN